MRTSRRGTAVASRIKEHDQRIGHHIRARRTALGMTQRELGDRLHLTYQQIHKYETGTDRVSAGILFHIAQILAIPVDEFFAGEEKLPSAGRERMTLEAVRNFSGISEPRLQDAVAKLARALARPDASGTTEPQHHAQQGATNQQLNRREPLA